MSENTVAATPTRENAAREIADNASDLGFDIPWELILALIERLIEMCFTTERAFAEACREPSSFQFWYLRRICYRSIVRDTKLRGREARSAAMTLASEMCRFAEVQSDAQLGAIYKSDP